MRMKNEKHTYLLLSYVDGDCKHARYFTSEYPDLDTEPYSNRCPVVVGSNQRVVKEQDATAYQLSLAEQDKRA
jgi:hypothetical protein